MRGCRFDAMLLGFMCYSHCRPLRAHILSSYMSCYASGASGPYTLAYRYLSDKVVERTRGELAFRQATEKGQVSARSDQLQVYGTPLYPLDLKATK